MKSTPSFLWAMKTANDKWCLENNMTSEWIRASLFAKPEMFAPVRSTQKKLKRESKDCCKAKRREFPPCEGGQRNQNISCVLFHLHRVYAQRTFCLHAGLRTKEVKLKWSWDRPEWDLITPRFLHLMCFIPDLSTALCKHNTKPSRSWSGDDI